MNIYDVSKKAGVSITTVSRVINGSDKVSEATRRRVLAVIEESGYTPNAFARGLGLDTMHTVGILMVDPSDPNACASFTQSLGSLQRELRRYNFDSVLYCVGYDMRDKAETLRVMCARRLDAVIILGSFFIENNPKDNQCIVEAARLMPVFLINGSLDAENVYSFLCDDRQSACDATAALIASGCRRILFLHQGDSLSERRKREGYCDALARAGLAADGALVRICPLGINEGADFVGALARDLSFDAVLATEDTIAMSVLKYANRNRIAVPEELSLIGYNNTLLAECCHPTLSTVDNNTEAACVMAVSALMQVLRGVKTPARTTVSSELVFRQSTRPVPTDPYFPPTGVK